MENNKLIAVFMGAKIVADGKVAVFPNGGKCYTDVKYGDNVLLYDCDWNWLMSVALKCYTVEAEGNSGCACEEYINDSLTPPFDIKDLYTAVVDFIEKHNAKKEA